MRARRIAAPALTAAVVGLSACVPGAIGSRGPVVSPTGIVYEPGIPPSETRQSQTATLYLRFDNPQDALDLALEGIDADPDNPIHYFLAGVAYARLGDHDAADGMFVQAEQLYPAYELDVEPEREAAWADAFNRGAEAYADGQVDEAIRAWRQAIRIYDLRPEAHRNLAAALSVEGRYEEAIQVYREALSGLRRQPATRVLEEEDIQERNEARRRMRASLGELLLFTERYSEAEPILRQRLREDPDDREVQRDLAIVLTGQGRHDEARIIYDALLSDAEMTAVELLNLGSALFRADQFEQASETFAQLIELRPESRDAWFNYVNALFAAGAWAELAEASGRLAELDPLSENAGLIRARAFLEQGDELAALGALETVEAAPAYAEGLAIGREPGETSVYGRIVGNQEPSTGRLVLRFHFYDETGELGAETLSLAVPPPDESEAFEVSVAGNATHYRYEVVESPADATDSP